MENRTYRYKVYEPGGIMNDIEKFIKKFQGEDTISIFTNNCSYWFAFILYKRFIRNGAKIMVSIESKYFGNRN